MFYMFLVYNLIEVKFAQDDLNKNKSTRTSYYAIGCRCGFWRLIDMPSPCSDVNNVTYIRNFMFRHEMPQCKLRCAGTI